jgi:ABC-type multidrug transport system ATPase subunit
MIIRNIFIPEEYSRKHSLARISLNELGQFIILSGKNGSGKTRLLNIIKENLKLYNKNERHIQDQRNNIFSFELSMIAARAKNDTHGEETFKNHMQSTINSVKSSTEFIISDEETITYMDFVPKPKPFRDYREDIVKKQEESQKYAQEYDISEMHQLCSHYIQKISLSYALSSSSNIATSEKEKEKIEFDYNSLKNIIKIFIDSDLTINSLGQSQLFGQPICDVKFSEGQNISLQIAVSLHAKLAQKIKPVFFLDEPENHLHPSSVVNFISNLEQAAPESQFFIATHSIPLISYIHAKDQNSLWFVENGSVKRAGRTPEHVLKSLLGGQDRINELRSFTELPSIYAQINYASQCLSAPGVHSESTGDSQNNQISEVLNQISIDRPLRVLDFGAGRGRILAGLAENFSDSLLKKIDYFAYDKFKNNSEECLSIIKRYYPDNHIERYKNELSDFMNNSNNLKGTFDIILMCNVLHEISPSDYYSLFEQNSRLSALLSDNGYILIVEDNQIPIGENAHKFGFIVLNTSELRELFSIPPGSSDGLVRDSTKEGRLTAHLVHKKHLKNITQSTIGAAITSVRTTAKEKMKTIRGTNQDSYKDGMGHAFWVQQYANACLYLEETGATP